MDDETRRYIEYLQRQLLTPHMEAFFDHSQFKDAMLSPQGKERRRRMAEHSYGPGATDTVDKYERAILNFAPLTSFDTFTSRGIFTPVVEDVRRSLTDMNMLLRKPVHLFASPDASPSPASRPTLDAHYIFAGEGTSRFCNYWGKVFAQSLADGAKFADGPHITREDMDRFFRDESSLVQLAIELVMHYSFFGNLLRIGMLPQQAHFLPFRMELVHAMEVFVIGHEFGHFLLEEHRESTASPQYEGNTLGDELLCDLLGFTICRYFGARAQSWFAFSGAAPLMFFRAMHMCEQGRTRIGSPTNAVEGMGTHPPTEHRVGFLRDLIVRDTHEEERPAVLCYIGEVEVICDALEAVVDGSIRIASGGNDPDRG